MDIDSKYADSFSGIELNIGCPSPKIMSCEAGSGMLRCRPKTLQIIQKSVNLSTNPLVLKHVVGLLKRIFKNNLILSLNLPTTVA
ncbi:tRNA-dihydrouridine synthase [Patescibacteria group bacterium]|nr:tRNA-dihydrouridine synthase [Patescibacteria group bacterium]